MSVLEVHYELGGDIPPLLVRLPEDIDQKHLTFGQLRVFAAKEWSKVRKERHSADTNKNYVRIFSNHGVSLIPSRPEPMGPVEGFVLRHMSINPWCFVLGANHNVPWVSTHVIDHKRTPLHSSGHLCV